LKEGMQIVWLRSLKSFVGYGTDFVFNTLRNFKPV